MVPQEVRQTLLPARGTWPLPFSEIFYASTHAPYANQLAIQRPAQRVVNDLCQLFAVTVDGCPPDAAEITGGASDRR